MILYFYGTSSYLIKKAISDIKQEYINKSGNNLSVDIFNMEESRLGELIDSITSVPLIAKSRLVIVQNLNSNQTASSKIEEIVNIVPKSTILIIEDINPDKKSRYFKVLLEKTKSKQFDDLRGSKLEEWVAKECSSQKIQIEKPLIRYLVQKVGEDMWQLKNEIDKLANTDSKIDRENIDELVVANIEQSVFELIDSIAQKDLKKSLEIYHNLVLKGVTDQQILAMLNWQYRNLVLAYENLHKPTDWVKKFKISSYVAEKSVNIAKKMDKKDLVFAYQAIIDADFSIKTGHKPSNRALEELIIKLIK